MENFEEKRGEKDSALAELQNLQWDYADGVGDHGPVIKEFSMILRRYRENYYRWKPYRGATIKQKWEIGYDNVVPMLITAAIVFAVYVLLFHVLHAGILLRILYYVAGAVALGYESENIAFGIFFGTLTGILSFVTGESQIYVVGSFLIIYILYAFIDKAKKFGQHKRLETEEKLAKKRSENQENVLRTDRDKLWSLLPQLKHEYAGKREQLIEKYAGLFSEAEKAELLSQLPEHYWWEILPDELVKMESEIGGNHDLKGADIAWETRWVQRDEATAFKYAGEEFSPLHGGTSEAGARLYDIQKKQYLSLGALVLDFITRGTSSRMETDVIEYEDYKYSDSTKSDVNFLSYLLAYHIDKDYSTGRVTEEEYAKNIGAYAALLDYTDEKMNETVIKERTEYHQVKEHTNFWTGQILLCTDELDPEGLAIIDYRCRIFQAFKNLDTLSNVRITRVLGNVLYRDPAILAKIHRVCPECR